MPKQPMLFRNRLQRRKQSPDLTQFFDFYFGVQDIEEFVRAKVLAEIEEKDKAGKEAKEKGAKEAKENFFKAKFTFTHMFLAVLTAGPLCGIVGYIFLRAIFG